MRIPFAMLVTLCSCSGAMRGPIITSHNVLPRMWAPLIGSSPAPPPPSVEYKPESPEWILFKEKTNLLSHVAYPWRIVDGETNSIVAVGWCHFGGEILQVHESGVIRVQGWYKPIGGLSRGGMEFVVINYPFRVADREVIGPDDWETAKEVGVYRYTTVLGSISTLRKLDWGQPCAAPSLPNPSAQEVEQARTLAEKRKVEAEQRVLQYQQALAEKNDPYGLFKMGDRYASGNGVA